MPQFYVNLYNGKGDKLPSLYCTDPMQGLILLGQLSVSQLGFEYTHASCFMLEPNELPKRQWSIEID